MIPTLTLLIASAAADRLWGAEPSWPRFRGPNGAGIAQGDEPLPDVIAPDQNVLWKTEVAPGRSSPVVSGGRIYLTGVREGDRPVTICVDAATGDLLWEVLAPEPERVPPAYGGDHAQVTCAVTENRVISFFGSSGLLCYDRDGALIWRKPFPPLNTQYGVASSPVIVDDRVILSQDLDTGSFLMSLRLSDGETVWEVERNEFIANFVTPVVAEVDQQRQIILPGSLVVIGYDWETGEEAWRVRGLSWSVVSTPVFDEHGTLFVNATAPGEIDGAIPMPPLAEALSRSDADDSGTFDREEFEDFGPRSGFFPTLDRDKDGEITPAEYEYVDGLWSNSKDVMLAIRLGGKGDVTDSHVLWSYDRALPFCPSPLYHDGHLYTVKSLGVVNVLDAKTGRRTARERRLKDRGEYYSSPVLGDGKIYIASERGGFSVITADPKWEEVSYAKFDDDIYATPAVADGRIFVRTTGSLYCFGYPDIEIARTEKAAAHAERQRQARNVRTAIIATVGCGLLGLVWISRRLLRRRRTPSNQSRTSTEQELP